MPKSIETRIAAAEKLLDECECAGRFVFRLSTDQNRVLPQGCRWCRRLPTVIVIRDPYAEDTKHG